MPARPATVATPSQSKAPAARVSQYAHHAFTVRLVAITAAERSPPAGLGLRSLVGSLDPRLLDAEPVPLGVGHLDPILLIAVDNATFRRADRLEAIDGLVDTSLLIGDRHLP